MNQSTIKVAVHGVWATRGRCSVIRPTIDPTLRACIVARLRRSSCEPLAFGAADDHVHVLFWLGGAASLSAVFRAIKSDSARVASLASDTPILWQAGFAAFAVEERSIDVVARYIENQRNHHRLGTQSSELEPLSLET